MKHIAEGENAIAAVQAVVDEEARKGGNWLRRRCQGHLLVMLLSSEGTP